MKKIVLAASVVTIVLMNGCGSSGDSKVDLSAVKVEYKNAATYDLSQYLIPTRNQINNYANTTFTNTKGKKDYKETPDEPAVASVEKYDVNGSIIKEFDGSDALITTSTVTADRISQLDEDGTTQVLARFADKGDYFTKRTRTNSDGINITLACKVKNHLETKNIGSQTYTDVLEVECPFEGIQTTTLGGQQATVKSEGSSINFFAKDDSLILSTTETCVTTKVGDNTVSKRCIKEIEKLFTIN